jgi:hypothetical protein
MRFNIIIAVSLLCTLVSGFAIPSRLSERDDDLVKSRRDLLDFADDIVELAARNSKKIKGQYQVAGGGGRPAREYPTFRISPGAINMVLTRRLSESYGRKDVKEAIRLARIEKTRLDGGVSNTQRRHSMLKPFANNNHEVPKNGASRPNSLPGVTSGNLFEFPLRNAQQGPATRHDKGPARVIMADVGGKLKFKGVVAHDQSRPIPPGGGARTPGANDHFEVKGSDGRGKKKK